MTTEARTTPAATTAPSRNADGQPSTVAAAPLTANGTTIPPVLTATSPSVMARVRAARCRSASPAQNRIVAEVPSRLMTNAVATLSANASA